MNYRFISFLLLFCAAVEAKILHITDENQYKEALEQNKNMVVEFAANWCSICNNIKKPYEELANEQEFQQVAFAQVDVDKLDDISKKNGIVGVPTFVYVENGAKKIEEIGVQNMPAFKDHLRENLRKNFTLAQNEQPGGLSPELLTEDVTVEMDMPVIPEPTPEPNIFVKIFNAIKDFIIMIFVKIKEFFTMIFDAIKGFFGK
jgi:thioredoxin 1